MRGWAVVAVATIFLAVGGGQANLRKHPGIVVDLSSHRGIAVKVFAYETAVGRRVVDGCPTYQRPITANESETKTGSFELAIPEAVQNYVVTYCQPGYYAREEQFNRNNPDGEPVSNAPVEMYPRWMNADALGAVLEASLRRLADTTAYIQKADPDTYVKAVENHHVASPSTFVLKDTIGDVMVARTTGRGVGGGIYSER